MRRIYNASIWAHHAIPPQEWKYRNLKRAMFPVVDFLYILAGFSAAAYGVPAISEFFPDPFVDVFAYALSLFAFVCLIGVSFPRFWPLEVAGKSALLGLMVGYFVALLMLTASGEGNRGFVLLVAGVSLCPIIWRLSLLGSEWQDRRIAQRPSKEA
jgi:hypothetical protein